MSKLWEFADLAEDTAKVLRKHFDSFGYNAPIRLDKAHWHLIILALERAAEGAIRDAEQDGHDPNIPSGARMVSSESMKRAARDMLADMYDEIDPGDCAP